MSIRRAVTEDALAMAEIAYEAYAAYLPRLGGQRPAPMDDDYRVLAEAAETWIIESGSGEVCGFLVLDGDLLKNLAVRPSWQGRGIGRRLLALAEDRVRSSGGHLIRLYTNEAMVENQRLYERAGYVETRRGHEDGFARVFYEKRLR
ncbi:GNAT family N-acetyltransferase [Sinomonas humi]|uniref:N-acetyltransferase domain-containing protein n=1 Tax=Sinomonas humi TaxID=1338436 RepID=A0A0B2AJE7_9MICC|nr:GNAT family N-acetyltransferase [Sinomonas humi]KHL01931.1 hypothetical protein LK10_14145 [Sinomonas humi]